jgi:hypothetical protein
VIVGDLLAQVGHRFGFWLIVEEGPGLRTDHHQSDEVSARDQLFHSGL